MTEAYHILKYFMWLQVMGPQIAQFRPAVLEADPDGVFAQKYMYELLGL